jgi:SAM-dependent methyltransferase
MKNNADPYKGEIPSSKNIHPFFSNSNDRVAHFCQNLDLLFVNYQRQRRKHWNKVACRDNNGLGGYYHRRLSEIYRNMIQPNQRLLEIGCGQGDLLSTLEPSFGVGVDFSEEMTFRAKKKHPDLHFILGDAHQLPLNGTQFDVIILSDLLNDVWDVQAVFENLICNCHPGSRIIINSYSRLWEVPLAITEKVGLAQPVLYRNWLTVSDIRNFLDLTGMDVIRTWQEILFPLKVPLVTTACNRFLVKLWPINQLALTNFLVCRPCSQIRAGEPGVSIVIPARNEEGNIEQIFRRLQDINFEKEVIFVEGNSRDHTFDKIQLCQKKYPQMRTILLRQDGIGKGDAVRLGFEHASKEILMILDADLTVPPHYLHRFYDAILSGKGEFINGVRLVYPMEKQAMRFINLVGNKMFSLLFTWLLGQPVKDTLCGTKVLWRDDYQRLAKNRSFFGDFDPFGDFDLLFGAAKLELKIMDVPVRYMDRTYGTTNISRWKHGLQLLRMGALAAYRLKFV